MVESYNLFGRSVVGVVQENGLSLLEDLSVGFGFGGYFLPFGIARKLLPLGIALGAILKGQHVDELVFGPVLLINRTPESNDSHSVLGENRERVLAEALMNILEVTGCRVVSTQFQQSAA